jgi:hypothetical protein
VTPNECNPNLADPPGLWVIILFPICNSLLDSHRTVEVQIRVGVNPPIVEATFDNDDLNQRLFALLSAEDE